MERAVFDKFGQDVGAVSGFTYPDCPGDIPVEVGRTFMCTAATQSGDPIEIRVTQTDAEGSFEVELATLIIERVERQIRREMGSQLHSTVAFVDCGQNRPLRTADTFECSAEVREDGRDLTIVVIQTDDAGNVRWEVSGGL